MQPIPRPSRLELATELAELPPADSIVGDVTLSRAYDRACDIAAEAIAECERYEKVFQAVANEVNTAYIDHAEWPSSAGRNAVRIFAERVDGALADLPKDPG